MPQCKCVITNQFVQKYYIMNIMLMRENVPFMQNTRKSIS